MEITGKLYGKFGNKHFDTGKTSEDFDKLERDNLKMLEFLQNLVSSEMTPLVIRKGAKKLIKESTQL
jgi:hypothetical protein